jgi:hypothetical protein
LTEAKTWSILIVHFDLGALLDALSFVEAGSEFERCLARHGEAMELFPDDAHCWLPHLSYYLGRGAGVWQPAPPYAKFVSIQAGDGSAMFQDRQEASPN